jgi:hypothetical protein
MWLTTPIVRRKLGWALHVAGVYPCMIIIQLSSFLCSVSSGHKNFDRVPSGPIQTPQPRPLDRDRRLLRMLHVPRPRDPTAAHEGEQAP